MLVIAPTATPPGARRAALIFIFITVLIDILAFGLIIPVLPHLVKEFAGGDKFAGGDTVSTAHWVALFGTMFALVQFVTSPIQGTLSDRFGRRPVILPSCLGHRHLLHGAGRFEAMAVVGRMISAVTSASFTTATATATATSPMSPRRPSACSAPRSGGERRLPTRGLDKPIYPFRPTRAPLAACRRAIIPFEPLNGGARAATSVP